MAQHVIHCFTLRAASRWVYGLVAIFTFLTISPPLPAQEVREWRKENGEILIIGKLLKVEGERIFIGPAKGKAGTISTSLERLSKQDRAYIKDFQKGTLPKAGNPATQKGFSLHSVEILENINGQNLSETYVDGVVEIRKRSRMKLVMARVEFKVNRGDPQSVVRLAQRRQDIVKELPLFKDWILIDRTTLEKYPPEKHRYLDKDLFEMVDRDGNVFFPVWVARQNCDSILLIDGELRFSSGDEAPPATRKVLRTLESYTGLISTSDTLTRMYLLYSVPSRMDAKKVSIRIAD
jgi:hypothetical protein